MIIIFNKYVVYVDLEKFRHFITFYDLFIL